MAKLRMIIERSRIITERTVEEVEINDGLRDLMNRGTADLATWAENTVALVSSHWTPHDVKPTPPKLIHFDVVE